MKESDKGKPSVMMVRKAAGTEMNNQLTN